MKILVFGAGSSITKYIKIEGYETIPVYKHECDVRILSDVIKTIKEYTPDIVINLSGVCNFKSIKEMDYDDVFEEVDVNLIGAFNISHACVTNGVKKIIFMGSLSGVIAKKNQGGYCASKRGIISLVQTLKEEGHEAYVISAGSIDTKLRDKLFPNEDKKKRMSPTEIVGVIKSCIDGKFSSGDNIIINKFGYETFLRVNNDNPWMDYSRGIE